MMSQTVTFYFDPVSPYSWLAARQLERLDAIGARVDFKPVLFAGLLAAHGTKGPAEIETKRAYTMRDVLRIATRFGLQVTGPPTHPFNPLRSLRMCVAIDDVKERRRFGSALLEGAWARGLDLTSDAVLRQLAEECQLDGEALLARANGGEIKQRLIDSTQEAVRAGVFGVPTFAVDGELFWGEDRIEALLWRLQGHTIDESLLATVLARPASAARRAD
ncbi:MAG: 2-hydroxychromene-2-carboxylate isomerase [Burkholderiaceae bacterium]